MVSAKMSSLATHQNFNNNGSQKPVLIEMIDSTGSLVGSLSFLLGVKLSMQGNMENFYPVQPDPFAA